jgi:hypothetical protein
MEALVKPSWSDSEIPTRVLEVSPSELKSKPYETEASSKDKKIKT